MKNRKYYIWFLSIGMGILLSLTAVLAYFSDSVTVWNHISLGDVDISLHEYEMEKGNEIAYRDPKLIMPGKVISKIPRIRNEAEDCYVRMHVDWNSNPDEPEAFSDQFLSGISSEWVRQGDFYYYKKILKKGECVDFFREIHIPEEWDNTHSEQTLSIMLRADAIQAANFIPDFQALSPWGNETIQKCIHEDGDRIIREEEWIPHQVVFEGTSHKLIAISEDFFSEFANLMPGDQKEARTTLKNTTQKEATLTFRTESVKGADEELLDQIRLSIYLKDHLLYEGPLHEKGLNKEIELLKLLPGEQEELIYRIVVPASFQNNYALRKTSVKWIFGVKEEDKNSGVPGGYGGSGVKTGDDTPVLLYIMLALSSLLLSMLLWKIRRVRRK